MPRPTNTDDIWVAGVDGCPAGWIVVLRNISRPRTTPQVRIVPQFRDVLAFDEHPAAIAVDIPIGLPSRTGPGGRACDQAARDYLGPRRSSVFGVPARAAVMETDYEAACATAFANSDPPRKISKQSFFIFPKIRDVDSALTPDLQNRIIECHPEVAFTRLNNGTPLDHPKKAKPDGPAQRIQLLKRAGFATGFLTTQHTLRKQASEDDFLDACICCWTAGRMHRGEAISFPDTTQEPPRDARGLAMQIWS